MIVCFSVAQKLHAFLQTQGAPETETFDWIRLTKLGNLWGTYIYRKDFDYYLLETYGSDPDFSSTSSHLVQYLWVMELIFFFTFW